MLRFDNEVARDGIFQHQTFLVYTTNHKLGPRIEASYGNRTHCYSKDQIVEFFEKPLGMRDLSSTYIKAQIQEALKDVLFMRFDGRLEYTKYPHLCQQRRICQGIYCKQPNGDYKYVLRGPEGENPIVVILLFILVICYKHFY